MPTRPAMGALLSTGVVASVVLGGCAGGAESAVRDDFRATRRPTPFASAPASPASAPASPAAAPAGAPAPDAAVPTPGAAAPVVAEVTGTPGQYLAWALAHSPAVAAAHARWEASVHRISRARRLPEPMLSFGVFLRAVETRVGPQRARVGVQQTFPWPSKLSAGSDAAAGEARAQAARFEALSLRVAQRVETAYWTLWEIRHTRAIHREHLDVIRGLSETVRARIATGVATLADQQQIDLAAARLEDGIRSMDEAERSAEAQLRAAVGMPASESVPTRADPPEPTLPAADAGALEAQVRAHPFITAFEWMAQAQESRARAEDADSLPSFTVGADWIVTGEARMPGVAGSGKDAVFAGVGVRVPLWQGSYDDSAAAARAEALSDRAEQRAAIDAALAELVASLSATRDAARRATLYADTLLPQADSAYESVLGAYTTGRGTVAQALLAQRDLLELRVKLEKARADHLRGWARLQQVVGRELSQRPYRDEDQDNRQDDDHE